MHAPQLCAAMPAAPALTVPVGHLPAFSLHQASILDEKSLAVSFTYRWVDLPGQPSFLTTGRLRRHLRSRSLRESRSGMAAAAGREEQQQHGEATWEAAQRQAAVEGDTGSGTDGSDGRMSRGSHSSSSGSGSRGAPNAAQAGIQRAAAPRSVQGVSPVEECVLEVEVAQETTVEGHKVKVSCTGVHCTPDPEGMVRGRLLTQACAGKRFMPVHA